MAKPTDHAVIVKAVQAAHWSTTSIRAAPTTPAPPSTSCSNCSTKTQISFLVLVDRSDIGFNRNAQAETRQRPSNLSGDTTTGSTTTGDAGGSIFVRP
jgi:hypothetical protein